MKFIGHNSHIPAALLSLVLSANLSLQKAKSMAKTVLSLGATCAQADMHGVTAFYRLVERNASALVDLLIELDRVGVDNSINHIAIPLWGAALWPLKKAIENSDSRLVLQLLDAGAVYQLDFELWLKAAKQSSYVSLAFESLSCVKC